MPALKPWHVYPGAPEDPFGHGRHSAPPRKYPGSINRVCPPEPPLGQGHRPFPAEVSRSPLLSLKPPGVSHSGEADLACHLHPWKKDSPWTWHRTPLTSQHRCGTVGQDRSLNGSRPCSAQVRLDFQPPPCPSSPLLPPHTGRHQSRCQPGSRSTKLPKPCGRVGAGSRGPIRSPLEDPFPDQPFSADSWGPRWQLSPLIPHLQLPGCRGSARSLCRLTALPGAMRSLVLLPYLPGRPAPLPGPLRGASSSREAPQGWGRPCPPPPLPAPLWPGHQLQPVPAALPSHPTRPVNLTVGRAQLA